MIYSVIEVDVVMLREYGLWYPYGVALHGA